jgi:hypothetical protein
MTGVDMRGRMMEMAVVVTTIWLSIISWGLVKGFFGNASACYGTVGSYNVTLDDVSSSYLLRGLRSLLLGPAQRVYLAWDRIFLNSWFRSMVCTAPLDGSEVQRATCFEHLPHANADFFLVEGAGGKCASDLLLVTALYMAAGVVFAGSALWKQHERHQRRRHGRRPVRGPHPHQD